MDIKYSLNLNSMDFGFDYFTKLLFVWIICDPKIFYEFSKMIWIEGSVLLCYLENH